MLALSLDTSSASSLHLARRPLSFTSHTSACLGAGPVICHFQLPYVPKALECLWNLLPPSHPPTSSVLLGTFQCSPNTRLHQQPLTPAHPKGGSGNTDLPVGVLKHRKESWNANLLLGPSDEEGLVFQAVCSLSYWTQTQLGQVDQKNDPWLCLFLTGGWPGGDLVC